jgi:hypothetical protein
MGGAYDLYLVLSVTLTGPRCHSLVLLSCIWLMSMTKKGRYRTRLSPRNTICSNGLHFKSLVCVFPLTFLIPSHPNPLCIHLQLLSQHTNRPSPLHRPSNLVPPLPLRKAPLRDHPLHHRDPPRHQRPRARLISQRHGLARWRQVYVRGPGILHVGRGRRGRVEGSRSGSGVR